MSGLQHAEPDRGNKAEGEHGGECPTRGVPHMSTPKVSSAHAIACVGEQCPSVEFGISVEQENLVTQCSKNDLNVHNLTKFIGE